MFRGFLTWVIGWNALTSAIVTISLCLAKVIRGNIEPFYIGAAVFFFLIGIEMGVTKWAER